jgi:hypothetical protein
LTVSLVKPLAELFECGPLRRREGSFANGLHACFRGLFAQFFAPLPDLARRRTDGGRSAGRSCLRGGWCGLTARCGVAGGPMRARHTPSRACLRRRWGGARGRRDGLSSGRSPGAATAADDERAADKCEDQPYGQLPHHRLPNPEAYSSSHGRTPTDVERRCAEEYLRCASLAEAGAGPAIRSDFGALILDAPHEENVAPSTTGETVVAGAARGTGRDGPRRSGAWDSARWPPPRCRLLLAELPSRLRAHRQHGRPRDP